MSKKVGDYLNDLETEGELTLLFKAGLISDKWAAMRNVYNYFDAVNDIEITCKKFNISKATFYRYMNILNRAL